VEAGNSNQYRSIEHSRGHQTVLHAEDVNCESQFKSHESDFVHNVEEVSEMLSEGSSNQQINQHCEVEEKQSQGLCFRLFEGANYEHHEQHISDIIDERVKLLGQCLLESIDKVSVVVVEIIHCLFVDDFDKDEWQ
jgi:hypothetical protein